MYQCCITLTSSLNIASTVTVACNFFIWSFCKNLAEDLRPQSQGFFFWGGERGCSEIGGLVQSVIRSDFARSAPYKGSSYGFNAGLEKIGLRYPVFRTFVAVNGQQQLSRFIFLSLQRCYLISAVNLKRRPGDRQLIHWREM